MLALTPTETPEKPPVQLPVSAPVRDRLNLIGMAAICEWIIDGDTQAVIAERLAVSQSSLAAWLANHPDQEMYRRAQEASAEVLVDKGTRMLENADVNNVSTAGVALLKVRVEQYNRIASMRSKRHREKGMDDTVAPTTVAPVFIIQAAEPPRVIEHE